jgi:hypothetical protein
VTVLKANQAYSSLIKPNQGYLEKISEVVVWRVRPPAPGNLPDHASGNRQGTLQNAKTAKNDSLQNAMHAGVIGGGLKYIMLQVVVNNPVTKYEIKRHG